MAESHVFHLAMSTVDNPLPLIEYCRHIVSNVENNSSLTLIHRRIRRLNKKPFCLVYHCCVECSDSTELLVGIVDFQMRIGANSSGVCLDNCSCNKIRRCQHEMRVISEKKTYIFSAKTALNYKLGEEAMMSLAEIIYTIVRRCTTLLVLSA